MSRTKWWIITVSEEGMKLERGELGGFEEGKGGSLWSYHFVHV